MNRTLEQLREEFPVFERRVFLNSCSYGALARPVRAAFEEYLDVRSEFGSRWDLWVAELERVRALLARLLGCDGDEVAVMTSVSECTNSLVSALDYGGGRDTVVTTDFDFPTTSQIFLAQQRRGARVVRVPADASGTELPLAQFDALIDERTLLVSVPYICYRNGVCTDPRPIVELARQRGAMVMIDAYQAVGSRPIDVRALGADFLVGGCLKYLLGTAGIGFMYVRDASASALQPTSTGWFAQADVNAMDIYQHLPHPSARRFESGTPNVPGLYAVRAGIELVLEVGPENIAAQIESVTGRLIQAATERGWALVTPPDRRGPLVAIACHDAPELVKRLGAAGIVVSDRDNNLRVSPHFYNNTGDIDRLVAALDANAGLIKLATGAA
ncbi:MAG: aminotransferase class V-fold PLP-dependent enzyme [Gammaproteobacteria bacterium]|nr:aminotransferase class V-fold PLP-dependent enzyme [Gammaproteobacteria bacterium]